MDDKSKSTVEGVEWSMPLPENDLTTAFPNKYRQESLFKALEVTAVAVARSANRLYPDKSLTGTFKQVQHFNGLVVTIEVALETEAHQTVLSAAYSPE